jgi:hypothetical protein
MILYRKNMATLTVFRIEFVRFTLRRVAHGQQCCAILIHSYLSVVRGYLQSLIQQRVFIFLMNALCVVCKCRPTYTFYKCI